MRYISHVHRLISAGNRRSTRTSTTKEAQEQVLNFVNRSSTPILYHNYTVILSQAHLYLQAHKQEWLSGQNLATIDDSTHDITSSTDIYSCISYRVVFSSSSYYTLAREFVVVCQCFRGFGAGRCLQVFSRVQWIGRLKLEDPFILQRD